MPRARDRHFDSFAGQTRLKHYVLRAYLQTWARVLTRGGAHQRVWFIDAFAGEGADHEGKPGSPLIACEIAHDIADEARERNVPIPELRTVAIELRKGRFETLRTNLETHLGECATALKGTLADHLRKIITMIGEDPALFFLDPCGVKGLSESVVSAVLTGPYREALILFADEGANRLRGAAAAPSPKKTERQPSLFDTDNDDATHDSGDARRKVVWARTAEASDEIMENAFGSAWPGIKMSLERTPRSERRAALLAEYLNRLSNWGATYTLPFSVSDENDRHQYYLVHASKHPKALAAMKSAIRTALNRRERESGWTASMLFASQADVSNAADKISAHFSGREVRWGSERSKDTLLHYAVVETQLLHSDMQELKSILDARGFRTGSRPLAYRFI